MKSVENVFLVLVTAPDMETARGIARELLGTRLVACVNLVPGVESHYWWNEVLETGTEVLMIIKTIKGNLSQVEETVLTMHPYETPEIVAFPLVSGNESYLAWLAREAGGGRGKDLD